MGESASILVIEDDLSINDIVCRRLKREGYEVCAAFSGTEAKMLLGDGATSRSFDLVLTDLMLPGLSGDKLVSLIRNSVDKKRSIPIIVISARTSPRDKVDLLSMGADDYLSKPFDLDELVARVQVQLRKTAQARAAVSTLGADAVEASTDAVKRTLGDSSQRDRLVLGRIALDELQRRVEVDGRVISLTRTEFDLLAFLLHHPKVVFTKQELYEYIWNEPYPSQENSVSAHISNIRTKLKSVAADDYIQTVWGIGFKVEIPESEMLRSDNP